MGPMTDITIVREFDAPRELVFDAWTEPRHFAVWFGGATADVPEESVRMDARPGGTWSATMYAGPERHEIAWHGRYVEIDRPARLVLTLTDEPEEGEPLTVGFEDLDGGRTRMTFRQDGSRFDADQADATRAGWQSFFDVLDDLLRESQLD